MSMTGLIVSAFVPVTVKLYELKSGFDDPEKYLRL